MTKQEILEYYNDINVAYNDCGKYDSLKNMLDELEQEIRNEAITEFAERLKENSIRGAFEYKPNKKEPWHKVRAFCRVVGMRKIDKIAEEMRGAEWQN